METVTVSPVPRARRHPEDLVVVSVVAVAVFLFASLGTSLSASQDTASRMWWPASGLVCALVVRLPHRRFPLLVAAAAATAAAAALHGSSAAACLAYAVASTLEALAFVAVLRLLGARTVADTGWHPDRAFDALRVAGAVAVAATAGAATIAVHDLLTGASGGQAWASARSLGAADLTGMVVLAPALLALDDELGKRRVSGRWLEGTVQMVATVVVAALVFFPRGTASLAFLTLLPVVWGAARLGLARTTVSLVLGTIVAALGTRAGGGPFQDPDPLVSVSLTQLLIVTSAFVALALGLTTQQRDRLTAELARNEESFRRTFDRALLGMAVLDLADVPLIEHGNPSLARMLERDPAGIAWPDLLDPGDHAKALAAIAAVRDGHLSGWHGELRHVVAGQTRWFEVALAPLPANGPEHPRASAQLVDVTERRQAEDRLRDLALHDALTGLPNRLLLVDRIGMALAGARRSGNRAALLFCDLDDFKDINDSAGHAAGDAVLVEVAQRVVGAVRPTDTVARLGGDEFVVCCPEVPDAEIAESIASRIIAALTAPVDIDGASYRSGASIGLALSGPDSTPESLLQDADTAMYVAKRDGKRQMAVFAPEQHEIAVRAVRIAEEAAVAVEADQLRLHFQPIVDLASGRVRAVEALVRWEHPAEGLLEPPAWLDVVAGGPLASEVGSWVLARAISQTALWWEVAAIEGRDGPVVHVNLFARQLRSPHLVDEIRDALYRGGLPGRALTLECNPAHLEAAPESVLAGLARLRREGVHLAVDDFGTGFGSLTHLTALPVDMVKIDRRVVGGLEDARGLAVTQAVIGIGRSLNLDVVAVGVETPAQRRRLEGLGCQRAQGFLWSAAVPADEVRWGVTTPGLVLPAMR